MSALIQTHSLTKNYKQGNSTIHALQNVELSIHPGRIVAVTGKSGCGKSTLLNILGGLDKASKGQVVFRGKDLSGFKSSELAMYRRQSVGIIFQSFNLLPRYTALGNIALALAVGGMSRRMRAKRAEMLLEKVGLEGRAHHIPSELSGGESQRVAIARALANNPELLLADEPTGNLDSETSSRIIGLLSDLVSNEGKTLVLVTHDTETAREIAHEVYTMKDGQIIH